MADLFFKGPADAIKRSIDMGYENDENENENALYPTVRCSALGHDCERRAWYQYRWVAVAEYFSGRMLRLFQTGHREEERIVHDLRRAGLTVDDVDPDTSEQWSLVSKSGHLTGHTDGIVTGVPGDPDTRYLLEIKTHNDKSFTQLIKHGLAVSKPAHLAQMQVYMALGKLDKALYVAKNKNNEHLHIEIVLADAAHGGALIAKSERVRKAYRPPARAYDSPDFYVCRFCHFNAICHSAGQGLQEQTLTNCRTCQRSEAIDGGAWYCHQHNKTLSLAAQKLGCNNFEKLDFI